MATQGILKIHVHEARLTRDTEVFGKMDPYCIFETRQQRVRTKMLPGAGKTPNWMGELVTIDVKYIGDDIHLSVWDEDPGKDDIIGDAEIKTSSMCVGSGIDEWYKLFFKGREVGVIHLRSIWEPRGGILVEKPVGMAQPVLIHTDGQVAGR
jgi:Ca2+-dependent lipid-binding protein